MAPPAIPEMEQRLQARRMVVWQEAADLADLVARQKREFTPEETCAWHRMIVEMDMIDTRLRICRDAMARHIYGNWVAQPNYTRRPPPPAWPSGCWDVLRWQ